MRYWVWAEDLATAAIGPFDTRAAAEAHIKFCDDRGDGAEMQVLEVEGEPDWTNLDPNMVLTPEQDRRWGSDGE